MKRVNAVVIGSGAAGGIVAKELATAGLSVVVLERGKWYTPHDCRKDDLRNQRTTLLGNAFGPDDDGSPRVVVDGKGRARTVLAGWRHGELRRPGLALHAAGFSHAVDLWRA
jgi:choline dehydrogenase-like flavoprotein